MPITTTATLLTPAGRGAVATVAVEGPQATELVEHHFSAASGRALVRFSLRRIVFGRWKSTAGPGEELVVCRLAEDRIEVHCHGGRAAVEAIMAALVAS